MNKYVYVVLVLLSTFLMGIAFPIGKMGMEYAPPFFLMSIRFIAAGALLALFLRKRQQPRGKQWLQVTVLGLFQSAGVMGCGYYSMYWITSGETAILTSSNPLIVIILSSLFLGAAYRWQQWFGVALGFAGVAVSFGLHLTLNPGTFISIAGAACFAISTLLVKRWGAGFDMIVMAAYQMLSGGIALLVLSLLTEQPHFIFTGASLLIIVWLAVMCSIIQFALWYYVLSKGDPAKTSAFLFLVPLFAVISSWLLLGETITWYTAAGGALICIGIVLVNGIAGRKGKRSLIQDKQLAPS